MTTLRDEQEKQRRWQPEPRFAGWRAFDEMLANEFRSADEHHAWECRALSEVVRHAVTQTSFYAECFRERGLRPGDVSSPAHLPRLPVLSKADVAEHEIALSARALPPGEQPGGHTLSSGTTGRPIRVAHSRTSQLMFSILWQRQARWFDLRPEGTLMEVRVGSEMGQDAAGNPNPDGNVVHRPRWRYMGQFRATGPEYCFNITNPVEQQVAVLRHFRPQYVVTYPGTLEEWLLVTGGQKPVDSLQVVMPLSAMLSPELRAHLEPIYGVPLQQSYGLNEMGKVALRCEAGRYHVHNEHCLVEIVDAAGQPCPPGQSGHLLVTTLRNLAMPLLRYDTGDMAEPVAGPCPCGRTSPSFGNIAGRFRRYAGLPVGTRQRVHALTGVFPEYPAEELTFLRRYQIHQDRENRFELRLVTTEPIPERFVAFVQEKWAAIEGYPQVPLRVVRVEHIPLARSGKLLDFVSELQTDAYTTPMTEAPLGG